VIILNTSYEIEGYGDVNIRLMNDVLCVPRLAKNLFFIKQLDKASEEIRIKSRHLELINKFGQTIANGQLILIYMS